MKDSSIEQEFERLADWLDRDFRFLSRLDIDDLKEHPAYNQILDLGKDIVPYLLNRPGWYSHHFLKTITGHDPSQGQRLTYLQIINAWKNWARKQGIMFENEQCWVILGKRLGRFWHGRLVQRTEGVPTEVGFDYNFVMLRKEKVLGFYHTHPSFLATPSSTDDTTMDAWASCLGRSLLCAIEGTDGLRLYLYNKNGGRTELSKFTKIGKRLIGVNWHEKSKIRNSKC